MLCVCASGEASTPKDKTVYFVCVIRPNAPFYEYVEYAYSKVFNSLGYNFELVAIRPDEAPGLLRDGQADGDCGHIPGYAKLKGIEGYLELDISMTALSYGAWSEKPIPEGLLKGKPIPASVRVGYLKGIAGSEAVIEASQHTNVVVFTSLDDGKLALSQGEIDIWIGRVLGVSQFNFRDKPKYYEILRTYPVIPLLHNRLAADAQAIEKLLAKEFHVLSYPGYLKMKLAKLLDRPAKDTIHFNCILNDRSPLFHKMVSAYRKAFKQVGKEFYMTTALPGRALANLNAGITDGSCARTEKVLNAFDQQRLIIIDVPVMRVEFQAWGHRAQLEVNGVEDIIQQKLRVGYRYGLLNMEQYLRDVPPSHLHKVIHVEQGVKMLAAKRLDIYIDSTERVNQAVQSIQFNTELYPLKVLLVEEAFPLLNSKHQDIAEGFAEHLREQIPPGKSYLFY
ncbi:hypothetical protein R50073_05580 [Maricurvus nonylphenolicus]